MKLEKITNNILVNKLYDKEERIRLVNSLKNLEISFFENYALNWIKKEIGKEITKVEVFVCRPLGFLRKDDINMYSKVSYFFEEHSPISSTDVVRETKVRSKGYDYLPFSINKFMEIVENPDKEKTICHINFNREFNGHFERITSKINEIRRYIIKASFRKKRSQIDEDYNNIGGCYSKYGSFFELLKQNISSNKEE